MSDRDIAGAAEVHTRADLHRQVAHIVRDLRALADALESDATGFAHIDPLDNGTSPAPYASIAATMQKRLYEMLSNSRFPTLAQRAAEADTFRAQAAASTGSSTGSPTDSATGYAAAANR